MKTCGRIVPSIPRGFTLVELLVVIGIISVLMSVLLPVMGNARERARAVQCQSNLKQMLTALHGFAAENKGRLPWGWDWDAPLPGDPSVSADPGFQGYTNWATSLAGWMNPNRMGVVKGGKTGKIGGLAGATGARQYANIPGIFRCPSVPDDFQQPVTYIGLPTAMPHRKHEYEGYPDIGSGAGTAPNQPKSPAKLNQLYSDNALIWETGARGTFAANDVNNKSWSLVGTYIDDGLLMSPTADDQRYREAAGILYGSDPNRSPNATINYPSRQRIATTNQDYAPSGGIVKSMIGNLRFRHTKNTQVNVGFADGSVRTFSVDIDHPKIENGDPQLAKTDFLRKYLQIKR